MRFDNVTGQRTYLRMSREFEQNARLHGLPARRSRMLLGANRKLNDALHSLHKGPNWKAHDN